MFLHDFCLAKHVHNCVLTFGTVCTYFKLSSYTSKYMKRQDGMRWVWFMNRPKIGMAYTVSKLGEQVSI